MPAEAAAHPGGAIYTRQSHGKERSIAEQESEGRSRLEANGWPLADVYSDRTSASRFARAGRPDWERLLRDVELRRFGVLWIWESSRGDRDAETWLGLLRRCRDSKVLIHVETHGRTYDMNNARDWRTLADDGIDNAYESEKTSLRVQRDLRSNAAKGRPHGVTLYGYQRIYDERTRELVKQCEHPVHGPVVRELFWRVAQGEAISRIAEDLNARGVPAPRGGKWGRATVRQVVINRGYIGRRPTGTREQRAQEEYDAIWEPLADEVTFWAVQRRLLDPSRKVTRPGRYLWLLSYLARCQECGEHLSAFRQGHLYGCQNGCVYILRETLDAYVAGRMLALCRRPEVLRHLAAADDADVARAGAEVDRLRTRLKEHIGLSVKGSISPATLAMVEAELTPQIKAAEERAKAVTMPPALRSLTAAGEHAEEIWEDMPVAARRDVIAMCYTISVCKSLRKVPRGGFDPDRVTMELRKPGES